MISAARAVPPTRARILANAVSRVVDVIDWRNNTYEDLLIRPQVALDRLENTRSILLSGE